MKRYTEYTKEELIELSSEKIQDLIDIEIAEAGIYPVMEPKMPDLGHYDIQKTINMYDVGGILFENISDAEAFMKMKRFRSSYDYKIGTDIKWIEDEYDWNVSINHETFYDKKDVDRIKHVLKENSRITEEYNEKKKEYDEFNKVTSTIRSAVMTAVDQAWEWKYKVDHAKTMMDKYLRLSDGDEIIAQRFFRDAFKADEELVEAILGIPSIKDVKVDENDLG